MTNKELVKRLRDWEMWDEGDINDTREEAADRIEELERILSSGPCEIAAHSNKLTEYMFHWEGRALDAEAKLAWAVEALQAFKDFDDLPLQMKRPDVFEQKVRQKQLHTLAELKGANP